MNDFEWGDSWRARNGNSRWGAGTAMRLKREKVVKIARLTGCKNFIGKSEKLTLYVRSLILSQYRDLRQGVQYVVTYIDWTAMVQTAQDRAIFTPGIDTLITNILVTLSTDSLSRRNKKLSCRRETASCFMSLNISLSHSRSLKIIRNATTRKLVYGFLFEFYSNYGSILYHFRDKARYWPKIAIFHIPAFDSPVRGPIGALP